MSKKRKKPKAEKKCEFLLALHRKSIEDILGFKGSNLVPYWNEHIVFENGFSMSVQCGFHSYSTPKKDLENLKDYDRFEVACFDNKNNWIVVRLKEWGANWNGKYDGRIPAELFDIEEGYCKIGETHTMPYVPKKDVELLYQYLKKQKRKFVIIEKHKKQQYE